MVSDYQEGIEYVNDADPSKDEKIVQYINVKLAALGQPIFGNPDDAKFVDLAQPLLRNHREKNRLLLNYLCPADQRIQSFINDYLKDITDAPKIKLPTNTFVLDHAGLARVMSLPPDKDSFESDIVKSYRIKQGVLHNPKHDRRTTQGSFHITEGGLPIPEDKKSVPKPVFARLLASALNPPEDHLRIPFTSNQKNQARAMVSLLLRPIVVPAAPGYTPEKTMEIHFFAPGNLVSNLDFVESIFGNAGDPYLPENDAGLDVDHWTGHTGCVILAPHLLMLTKKELGLPAFKDATERQKRDGLCWKKADELYNDGGPFKLTCRNERGVMITLIADNYFGYCKKEVKTQISYAANLYGQSEEEHSGGAIAFPGYVLGQDFSMERWLPLGDKQFKDTLNLLKNRIDVKPEGYAVDKKYPTIIYLPEDTQFHAREQTASWSQSGIDRSIRLLSGYVYILPNGYKVHMEKQLGGPAWRLVGTVPEGTLCHKPSTVSGGGKSEISKSISYAMIQGPVFIRDFYHDFDEVEKILKRDYKDIYKEPPKNHKSNRPILSPDRSLGSVIKLFSPSEEYTDEYNNWLTSLPNTIKQLVIIVKRYYKPHWGDNWRDHFSVDRVNGFLGHELRYDGMKLVANYLRVGTEADGSWRIYKTRPDFHAAAKVQFEDDITASVTLPREALNHLNRQEKFKSVKLVTNCERMLFQRPDDCVHRGYDKQAEADLSTPNSFLSNFEPLTRKDAKELIERIVEFDQYSDPVKNLILDFYNAGKPDFFVSSAHPRVIDGKPSKNPRYLQRRPDLVNHHDKYLSEIGVRLHRGIPIDRPVHFPVNAVLAGRRCNPPDPKLGVPALAVFNPIHYQELPELFMDFICSLTGKSPSTTGFGSEGALTKGPFNALPPVHDLNNALVSYILTGYPGFTSAAGYIGPKIKVEHDISLLVPEIWCRLKVTERDPKFLIEKGHLEKIEDFDHKGEKILASRLGYRITRIFVQTFLGRIFETPQSVLTDEMLKPELQDLDVFAKGVKTIVDTMKTVAMNYFMDGSVEKACPPLKALLHIMADGQYEGKDLSHPEIRRLFDRDQMIGSDWYQDRIRWKQTRDTMMWERHVRYLTRFFEDPSLKETAEAMNIAEKLKRSKDRLTYIASNAYFKRLQGTLGADPGLRQYAAANAVPQTGQPTAV